MSDNISVVALFCSDVREEKAGTVTIVGVFPDNMNVSKVPAALPKLCVYVRMHVHVDFDPGPLFTRIVMDGQEVSRSDVQDELIQTTRAKGKAMGRSFIGLISTFAMSPLPIAKAGQIQALVTAGGKEYVAGSLNFQLAPKAT
jgi:hypothetical protein